MQTPQRARRRRVLHLKPQSEREERQRQQRGEDASKKVHHRRPLGSRHGAQRPPTSRGDSSSQPSQIPGAPAGTGWRARRMLSDRCMSEIAAASSAQSAIVLILDLPAAQPLAE